MDNSEKEAKVLFELLKSKIKDGNLSLLDHDYKRKYVVPKTLGDYTDVELVEDMCSIERYTSDIFGKENEGLNRDGWQFNMVQRLTYFKEFRTDTFSFITWFKNRHKNYGSLVIGSGWSGTPYLNITNLGEVFETPEKTLIEDWVEPHKLVK